MEYSNINRQVNKYGSKVFKLSYIWIPMSIFIRYLRITPMMMYITSLQWKIQDQLPYSYRIQSRDHYDNMCSNTWYTILFYYQNIEFLGINLNTLQGLKEFRDIGCMNHLWYLQCDMQIFLLLPFICLIYYYNNKAGIITSLLPTIVCIVIRIHYAIYYNLGYSLFAIEYPTKNGGDLFSDSYIQPWTRMAPYFIGVSTMLTILYINDTHKGYKLSKHVYLALMLLSGFMLLMLVFLPYDDIKNAPAERWSSFMDSFTYVVNRPLWGIALSLLCIALYYKPESLFSIVNHLLSFEFYQPLGM